MVEDIARNLVSGRRTRHDHGLGAQRLDWAAAESDADHIHHVVDDLGRLSHRRRGCRATTRQEPR